MSAGAHELTATNPFCTRRTRPGAIPFVFIGAETVSELCDRLCASDWRGEIVGPHGSGKSTLVAALSTELARRGRRCRLFQLRDGEYRMPSGWKEAVRRDRADIVVIDGFEKIRPWGRYGVQRNCRQLGAGLVATAHASCGLPSLYRTSVTMSIARQVVDHLYGGCTDAAIVLALESGLAAHAQNLRETLFDLYDAFEKSKRRGHARPRVAATRLSRS